LDVLHLIHAHGVGVVATNLEEHHKAHKNREWAK
jgi:hypothetical protein